MRVRSNFSITSCANGAYLRTALFAHEVMLKFERTRIRIDYGRNAVVAHRHDARRDAEPVCNPVCNRGKSFTGPQTTRALNVHGEITVAEAEPGGTIERVERAHEGPCLVIAAPPQLLVGKARERIDSSIDVRRDV